MNETEPLSSQQQRSNLWRLALAQALSGANGVVAYATGAIVGHQLAPNPNWATLPISIYVIGMAACILPVGYIGRRFGRQVAFLSGAGAGTLAGLIAASALIWQSFFLFCLAFFLAGAYAAVVLSFRFAATDGQAPHRKARALSLVMAGGVAAGIFGPQLINLSMNVAQPVYLWTFFAQAAVALLSAWVLLGVQLPVLASQAAQRQGRKLSVILHQPAFIAALLCGAVSYLLMNFLMTAAPLAMFLHGHSREVANHSVQWHVIAMYAPSFFTGRLIERFGAVLISLIGLILIGFSIVIALLGMSASHFLWFLILLGIGWNFGFLGASAMVVQCHTPQEKTQVQSFNDFVIFSLMAAGSLLSGALLNAYGWQAILAYSFIPLTLALLCLLGLYRKR